MKQINWDKAPEGTTHAFWWSDNNGITWVKDVISSTDYKYQHKLTNGWGINLLSDSLPMDQLIKRPEVVAAAGVNSPINWKEAPTWATAYGEFCYWKYWINEVQYLCVDDEIARTPLLFGVNNGETINNSKTDFTIIEKRLRVDDNSAASIDDITQAEINAGNLSVRPDEIDAFRAISPESFSDHLNKTWDGEGLPPVGTELVYNGDKCCVLATHSEYVWLDRQGVAPPARYKLAYWKELTPLLTEQEILISEALGEVFPNNSSVPRKLQNSRLKVISEMIKAGYRKIPENVKYKPYKPLVNTRKFSRGSIDLLQISGLKASINVDDYKNQIGIFGKTNEEVTELRDYILARLS